MNKINWFNAIIVVENLMKTQQKNIFLFVEIKCSWSLLKKEENNHLTKNNNQAKDFDCFNEFFFFLLLLFLMIYIKIYICFIDRF